MLMYLYDKNIYCDILPISGRIFVLKGKRLKYGKAEGHLH